MVLKTDFPIVLASYSTSRKMLLEQAGLTFRVLVSGVDETVPESFSPAQTVECLAKRKGLEVAKDCPDSLIIAADSVVSIDGRIIGKPVDDEDAKATLRLLSGRIHEIYTGVFLLYQNQERLFHQSTQVEFYPLTQEEIEDYVSLGESRGKAGSYGIEGMGVTLIKGIHGDYSNIVGLPLAETLRKIKDLTNR